MGGGMEYMKSPEGILDQWEVIFGFLVVICFRGAFETDCGSRSSSCYQGNFAWLIICAIFAVISLVLLILKVAGIELPKLVLVIYYIIAAVVVLITAFIVHFNPHNYGLGWGGLTNPHLICSVGMGVFYIYSAILALG